MNYMGEKSPFNYQGNVCRRRSCNKTAICLEGYKATGVDGMKSPERDEVKALLTPFG